MLNMKVVMAGGKFNRIHPGHIWLLKKARKLGDRLVVVLAHDVRNQREYALPAKDRKRQLETLKLADDVVIGHKKDFFSVIEKFRPSVIVLGYDQELPEDVEKKLSKKIKIVRLRKYMDYSTGKLSNNINCQ